MHRFNPANHKKLDSEERRKLTPPEFLVEAIEKTAMDYLKTKDAVTVADVGCGSGFFSIPLIKRLKKINDKNILFFALDISDKMIGMFNKNLRKEIKDEDISDVKCIKCEDLFLSLGDNSVNILLMTAVFHEIEDKQVYLQEIKRVLKDEGTFFLLDWKKEEAHPTMGPPLQERVSTEEAVNILQESGFNDINILPLYPSFFTLISKK